MKEKLQKLLEKAFVPCSNFRVACILVTTDNNEIEGVNVEWPSYIGGGICAERNAINAAYVKGYRLGSFKEIHIMVDNDEISFPCFVCRQAIVELCGKIEKIYLYNSIGESKSIKYDEIIINAYTEEDLK